MYSAGYFYRLILNRKRNPSDPSIRFWFSKCTAHHPLYSPSLTYAHGAQSDRSVFFVAWKTCGELSRFINKSLCGRAKTNYLCGLVSKKLSTFSMISLSSLEHFDFPLKQTIHGPSNFFNLLTMVYANFWMNFKGDSFC